jgi:spermidine/putrescine transport system permease protein
MISNIVVSLFGAAFNWPLGAAVSLCLLLGVLAILWLTERLQHRLTFH